MNIKKLRKQKGWTQQDLAKKVGLTRKTINLMENGKAEIQLLHRLAFERVFHNKPLRSNLN